jgi:septum formation protein
MLSETEIENYLKTDEPFDCAGSYKIEKAGLALIEKIESKDPSAIQGLPMLGLTRGFQELGISIAELWRQE